jgi:hypothetical protein
MMEKQREKLVHLLRQRNIFGSEEEERSSFLQNI